MMMAMMMINKSWQKIARERNETERRRDSATKKLSLIPVMSVKRLSI